MQVGSDLAWIFDLHAGVIRHDDNGSRICYYWWVGVDAYVCVWVFVHMVFR